MYSLYVLNFEIQLHKTFGTGHIFLQLLNPSVRNIEIVYTATIHDFIRIETTRF